MSASPEMSLQLILAVENLDDSDDDLDDDLDDPPSPRDREEDPPASAWDNFEEDLVVSSALSDS